MRERVEGGTGQVRVKKEEDVTICGRSVSSMREKVGTSRRGGSSGL